MTPTAHGSVHQKTSTTQVPDRQPRRREQPADERLASDHAQYTCVCGFVFEAPVSTSVGCPHCGGKQAW